MSKRVKLVVILAAIAIMAIALTGCASSKERAYIGKWDLVSAEMNGTSINAADLKKSAELKNDVYINFKKEGKADAALFGEKSSIKWSIDKKDDKKIVIDDGSDKMEGTLIKKNELKLEMKEYNFSMTFKKK